MTDYDSAIRFQEEGLVRFQFLHLQHLYHAFCNLYKWLEIKSQPLHATFLYVYCLNSCMEGKESLLWLLFVVGPLSFGIGCMGFEWECVPSLVLKRCMFCGVFKRYSTLKLSRELKDLVIVYCVCVCQCVCHENN